MKVLLCALAFWWFGQVPAVCAAPIDTMAYGDSLSIHYPFYLQQARPDLTVYGRGLAGDVSWNIARFDAALAERQWENVIIMIGTNDVFFVPTYDPHQTFQNIRTMANKARNAGAEVWLMTQTPCAPPCATISQSHTLAVANELAAYDLSGTHNHIHVLYLRDQFTILDWADYNVGDGLHYNVLGQMFVGDYVGAQLP